MEKSRFLVVEFYRISVSSKLHFLLSYTCDISDVLLDKRDKVLHKQFKVIPVIYPAHLLLRPVRWSFFSKLRIAHLIHVKMSTTEANIYFPWSIVPYNSHVCHMLNFCHY